MSFTPSRIISAGLLLASLTAASSGAGWPGGAVPLSKLAERHTFVSYSAKGRQITLKTRFNTFLFEGETRTVRFNGTLLWLHAPVVRRWSGWMLSDADVATTILPLINPPGALRTEGCRTVLLDPGHGGDDQGASSPHRRLREKDVNLILARRVQAILMKNKVDARLTRSRDETLSLDQRCRLAGRGAADLFVSIHLNSAASHSASGVETHVLPPAGCPITAEAGAAARDKVAFAGNRHDAANTLLGYYLQRSLVKYTRLEDRGVRRSRFYVIRNVNCPAALVECGFLSNAGDSRRLADPAFQDSVARAIAEGLLTYLNKTKQARGRKP